MLLKTEATRDISDDRRRGRSSGGGQAAVAAVSSSACGLLGPSRSNMEIKLFQLSAIASIFLAINAMPNGRPGDKPPYVGCLDSNDCEKGSCCSVGMLRYSIPVCIPVIEIGDKCNPTLSPQNVVLSYPDNSTVYLTNVYYNSCPCMAGLICSGETETCEDPTTYVSFNFIDY